MADRLREYQPELVPPWLNRRWGSAWVTSFGLVKDAIVEAASQATQCAIVTRTPEDALTFTGADRDIERAPNETASAYRARLEDAWTTWEQAGTDLGLVNAFAGVGLTARIRRNNQWVWDSNSGNVANYWARLWIIIDQPHPYTAAATWGGGTTWGSSETWGIDGASSEVFDYLKRLARKWKASHAQLVNIIVVFSGTLWGDGKTWGSGKTWGGSAAYL